MNVRDGLSMLRRSWQPRRAAVLLSVIAGLFLAMPLAAQEADVPVGLQIPLFLKVVSFDRQLASRMDEELVVAVAYQGGNRESVRAMDDVVRAIRSARGVPGMPELRVVSIDLDKTSLVVELARRQVTILYVAPLRSVDIAIIADAARAARVTTFTGTPRYLSDGLAVSVRYQGERPKLLINVDAARLEGAEFSAELLKLAQVM
jgi:hypothetical protein